jgi:tetratricopeptide (TPR) repeat protein
LRKPLGGVRLPKKPVRAERENTQLTRAMQQHYAGDPAGALAHYVSVLRRDLNNPTALYFAALAKDQLGHAREEAIPYMLKCLQLLRERTNEPNIASLFADASFNLGKFYLSTGDDEQAFVALMAALEHNPQHTEALVGIGDHLWAVGDRDAAAAHWVAALQATPRCPEAAHYRSFLRLRCGDAGGWADYEARWACRMFLHQYGREEYRAIPLWTDQDLTGKRLIVHGEQGHGDVIQCARYLPLLRDRGAHVILEAHKPLVRLLRHSFPWLEVFERETVYPGVVDLQVPSFSLPHRLGGVNPNGVYLQPINPRDKEQNGKGEESDHAENTEE